MPRIRGLFLTKIKQSVKLFYSGKQFLETGGVIMHQMKETHKKILIQFLQGLQLLFIQFIAGGSFIFGVFSLFCTTIFFFAYLVNGFSSSQQNTDPLTALIYTGCFFGITFVALLLGCVCLAIEEKLNAMTTPQTTEA